MILHKDEYLLLNIPVVSLKIIHFEIVEHIYSLPDGSIRQKGYSADSIKPSSNKWLSFQNKMEQLPSKGCWSGEIMVDGNRYHILDGTQWEFYYEFQEYKIEYSGSNEWPEEYRTILEALLELTRFRRLYFSPYKV
jgi:hypothetical protein